MDYTTINPQKKNLSINISHNFSFRCIQCSPHNFFPIISVYPSDHQSQSEIMERRVLQHKQLHIDRQYNVKILSIISPNQKNSGQQTEFGEIFELK